ncbi:MAG: 4-alpha-glucanotransferase, partial [Mobilicoccus sp.]|nr:4-alpha-glucanotransferase [Mobilicoccus sp.]
MVTDTSLPADLAELARAYGVATDYWDWQGEHVSVAPDTIRAVLAALGVDTDDAAAALTDVTDRRWRRRLPPVVVATQGSTARVPVHVPDGDPVSVWVELEGVGARRDLSQLDVWVEPRSVDGERLGEATFEVPDDVPLGWHTLHADHPGSGVTTSALVVAPARLNLPERVAAHGAKGLMNQIYSVRSQHSWGVGDFGDVAELGAWSARDLGADFMLINPVHAAEPTAPMEASPYLPTSRRFVNPLYIRVEDIPEVAYLPASTRAEVAELAERAARLNDSDRIDRDTAWEIKEQALR